MSSYRATLSRNLFPRKRHALLVWRMGVLVVTGMLVGCGFHLRGTTDAPGIDHLPPELQRVQVHGEPSVELTTGLQRSLRALGVEVVESTAQASGVVDVLSERWLRRVLSIGSDGKVREYELSYIVNFRALDESSNVVVPLQQVNVVRGYFNPEIDVLAKAQEEKIIREEMVQEAARLMLQRLQKQFMSLDGQCPIPASTGLAILSARLGLIA